MTGKSNRPTGAAIDLAPVPGAPGQAREFLTRFVGAEGADEYAEDGRLVISELVTNAVQYGAGTEMSVDLELTEAGLEVGVYDGGPGEPHITPAAARESPAPHETGGRGLVIVARIAQKWGVQFAERGGKRVWCVLAVCA